MAKNKEIKAGFGYMVGNILIKGISFITLPVFSRLLSTNDYGLFNTYVAYEGILTILISMGMYSSIRNAQYDFPGKINTFVSTQIQLILFATCILIVAILVFSAPLEQLTGFGAILLIVLVLQSFGESMLGTINAKLAISYNYISYLVYAAFNSVGNVLISVFLVLFVFSDSRFEGRALGSAIPLVVLGFIIVVKALMAAKPKFDKSMARYSLKFGFPLIWHYLAQQISSQADRIMITKMVGASETGIYSFAYSIAGILQIIFYSLDNVWSVWIFNQMHKNNFSEISKKSRQYILLVGVIAGIMIAGSKEFIEIMGPKSYWVGSSIFIPIIVGMFFLFLYTIPVGIEYYFKQTKYVPMATFFSAFLNVILNLAFIPKFGYIAAGFTTTLSYILLFFIHWSIAQRILTRKSIPQFLSFRYFLSAGLIISAVGVMVYLLNPYPLIKYLIVSVILIMILWSNRFIIIKSIQGLSIGGK